LNIITGSKGRPSALRTIPVAESLDEDGAEHLEVDMADQRFQWIARPGQTLHMFGEVEQTGFVHGGLLPDLLRNLSTTSRIEIQAENRMK